MDEFLKTAKSAAIRAGDYALSRKGRIGRISYKGAINLVTDVDKKNEELIVGMIKKKYPSHGILSEEAYSKNTQAEFKWIIDPIDGTTNYSRGLPIYCVSIALEIDGQAAVGVVYDPERRELFTAVYKKGSYLNGKKIHVSKTSKIRQGFFVTGFAYNIHEDLNDNIENFKSFLKKCLAVRRLGSAALDLASVACGRFDGFWEMNLNPWDAAAGALIVKEAGGKVTKFDGSEFVCYDKELLSSNTAIHGEMIKILKKSFK